MKQKVLSTVKVLLKKYKHNGEIEFAPVYFNSFTSALKSISP